MLYLFLFWAFAQLGKDLNRRPSKSSAPGVIRPPEVEAPIAPEPTEESAALVVVSGSEPKGTVHLLDREVTDIGRDLDNHIVVHDSFASHHHARITNSQRGHLIEDLGSTNSTLVQGKPVKGLQRLRNGQIIQVGQTTFQFREA